MKKAHLMKIIVFSLILIASPINANNTIENQCSDKNASQCLSEDKNKKRKIKGKNDILKYMTATLASLFAFKNIESLTSENSEKSNTSITIEGNNNNNNSIYINSNDN